MAPGHSTHPKSGLMAGAMHLEKSAVIAIRCEKANLSPSPLPSLDVICRSATAIVRPPAQTAGMKVNSARAFQRREDYQSRQSPRESPFRQFDVSRVGSARCADLRPV